MKLGLIFSGKGNTIIRKKNKYRRKQFEKRANQKFKTNKIELFIEKNLFSKSKKQLLSPKIR